MTRRMLVRAIAALFAASLVSSGAVLFQDDFSNGLDAWSQIPTGSAGVPVSSAGGVFTIETTTGLALYKHDAVYTNFTFTATISSLHTTYSSVGIFFCMGDALGGYVLTLDNIQRFSLMKVPQGGGSLVNLAMLPNSHINAGTNVVTVNHYDNQITILCNGRLLTTLSESTYPSGKIGLVVGNGEKAAFDNVIVSDVPATEAASSCFTDDFSDGNLGDWYTASLGDSAKPVGGAMRLFSAASDANGTTVFQSGDYDSSSVQFVVSKVSGSDSADYGLSFTNVTKVGASSYTIGGTFLFVINSVGQYGIKDANSSQYFLLSKLESPIHGGTGKDTLKVVRKPGRYLFYANSRLLDSVQITGTYAANGVGFMVSPGLTVDFDDVVVTPGDSPGCLATRNLVIDRSPVLRTLRPSCVYDLAGRRIVGRGTADVTSFATGRYIVSGGVASRIVPIR